MIFPFKNSMNSAAGLFQTICGWPKRLRIQSQELPWNASAEQREERARTERQAKPFRLIKLETFWRIEESSVLAYFSGTLCLILDSAHKVPSQSDGGCLVSPQGHCLVLCIG